MKIIIDTERETKKGLLAAIRMLRSLLGKNEDDAAKIAHELPLAPLAPKTGEAERAEEKSKAEEGFINIFAGELPTRKKENDELCEDDFDFETY